MARALDLAHTYAYSVLSVSCSVCHVNVIEISSHQYHRYCRENCSRRDLRPREASGLISCNHHTGSVARSYDWSEGTVQKNEILRPRRQLPAHRVPNARGRRGGTGGCIRAASAKLWPDARKPSGRSRSMVRVLDASHPQAHDMAKKKYVRKYMSGQSSHVTPPW